MVFELSSEHTSMWRGNYSDKFSFREREREGREGERERERGRKEGREREREKLLYKDTV